MKNASTVSRIVLQFVLLTYRKSGYKIIVIVIGLVGQLLFILVWFSLILFYDESAIHTEYSINLDLKHTHAMNVEYFTYSFFSFLYRSKIVVIEGIINGKIVLAAVFFLFQQRRR